jgi:hypothetical protein
MEVCGQLHAPTTLLLRNVLLLLCWVDPRASLDVWKMKAITLPGIKPLLLSHPIHNLITILNEL